MVAQVEIYSSTFCPYCLRAKKLLDRKGTPYTVIDVDAEPGRRDEMKTRANGRRTVPQIFIDDRHVGGCDDLLELDFDGELDSMLGLAN